MIEPEEGKVFIIDDDESIRRSISLLLMANGFSSIAYGNAAEFFAQEEHDVPGCILCDVFLEGDTGLELQKKFVGKYSHLPLIYISGFGDIPMSVEALKNGAISFLEKPVDEKLLVKTVKEGLEKSKIILRAKKAHDEKLSRLNTLTNRELEVLLFVVKGFLNKQIASELNIAEQTVKIHRGNITSKLGLKSVADLVIFAKSTGII